MVNFAYNWQDLSFSRKTYLLALIVATVSTFLPWFSDNNEFVSGNIYLGLTGPASFLGLSIFVISVLTLTQEIYFMFKGKLLLGETVSAWLYNGAGLVSLYLAGLSASIFLHPDVGANLLAKQMLWGFYAALIAYTSLLIGIFIQNSGTKVKTAMPRRHQSVRDPDRLVPMAGSRELSRDRMRTLTIEDVASNLDQDSELKNEWSKQKELEHKIDDLEGSNIF